MYTQAKEGKVAHKLNLEEWKTLCGKRVQDSWKILEDTKGVPPCKTCLSPESARWAKFWEEIEPPESQKSHSTPMREREDGITIPGAFPGRAQNRIIHVPRV